MSGRWICFSFYLVLLLVWNGHEEVCSFQYKPIHSVTQKRLSQLPILKKSLWAKSKVLHEEYYDLEEDEDLLDAKNNIYRNDKEWMFFDVSKIHVKGGDGGDGCVAMRREYCVDKGGPSGGNGGDGGSVYLECNTKLNTLALLRRKVHHTAKDGTNGRGDSRHGFKGDDTIIQVPPGTIVRDENGVLAGELYNAGDRMLVAKGGEGGRGNEHFKTPRMNAPVLAERGEKGASRWLNIELKLLADVGLIGVPNAGKSTLLAASTNAKPKIADYPFTTIVPNLGVCDLFEENSDSSGFVLADIPGLLEGAHEGVGLGLAFLRHVQRCRILIHLIKGDSPDPIGDFNAINNELELFNPKLLDKPQIIVINKIDIPEVFENTKQLETSLKKLAGHNRVMSISAVTGKNVKLLMQRIKKILLSLPKQSPLELFSEEEERVNFNEKIDDKYEIMTDINFPGQFRIVSKQLEKLVDKTNWDYYESQLRFQRILEAKGINDALLKAGANQGDLIMIGDMDFDFWDKKNQWLNQFQELNPRNHGDKS